MAKSPAFQFYPKDWFTSKKVMRMTPEQRGGYINLLAHEWLEDDCSLPDDDNELAFLSGLNSRWPECSKIIRKCFEKRGDKLYNLRLLEEVRKQESFRKQCSDAGKKSAEVRKNKELSKVGSTDVQGGCNSSSSVCSLQSSSLSSITSSKKKKPLPEQASRLAGILADEILKRLPNKIELKSDRREKSIKKWAEAIDKLNRINGHSWKVIEETMLWSQNDDFWQSNILSGDKLRKQFDMLQARMQQNTDQSAGSPDMSQEEYDRKTAEMERKMREGI